MKVYIAILFSLVFTSVYNFDYEKISMNSPLTAKSDKDSLKFYQLSLNDVKTVPNEIKIETQIIDSKNPSSSTIGVHYQPFKKSNFNQIKKEVLGKPLILDNEFIKSAFKERQKIYLGIYCENCMYKINVIPSGGHVENKNFIQTPPLRKLINQGDILNVPQNNTQTRMDAYSANGISGLVVALFMVFMTVIACIIMMNTYVHNTALVEQPLKLGRVEA